MWVKEYYDSILFLPPNDHGEYDWQYAPPEQWVSIRQQFDEQFKAGGSVGIALMVCDTDCGANFTFLPGGKSIMAKSRHPHACGIIRLCYR
jgi:hypothetical protein